MDPTQKGGKWEQVCESAGGEERAAEGESQRHEERESSSNRPELAAFVMALHGSPVTKPMLYLCDNQALLNAVKIWVG